MVSISTFDSCPDLCMPKRIMKYVLLWCASGEAVVVIDGQEFTLRGHEVLTITSGQYHYFKSLGQASGYVLEFTLDFFCKDDHDIELVFENGLFCHFDRNECIPIPKPSPIGDHLAAISHELSFQPYQYLISVRSRIGLVLVGINRAKIGRGDEIWKPSALFLKFLEMVRASFAHNYPLAHFCEALGTTDAKLNKLSKQYTGKTAQNVVYGLIASEAKRLLNYEKLSVKETAYRLGFNDPFYFSNFFKKSTGLSPKAYRESLPV